MRNPEFKAFGSEHMRWVETGELDEPGTLTTANEYLRESRLHCTNGYYCGVDCDEIAVPAVYAVGDERPYFAAVFDPYNTGSGVVDFADEHETPEEAARAAHGLAERYAESEREYQEKADAYARARESLPEDIQYLRRAHTRAISQDDATGARTREELRERVSRAVSEIRELERNYNGFKDYTQ
jgi:hypothetical protein